MPRSVKAGAQALGLGLALLAILAALHALVAAASPQAQATALVILEGCKINASSLPRAPLPFWLPMISGARLYVAGNNVELFFVNATYDGSRAPAILVLDPQCSECRGVAFRAPSSALVLEVLEGNGWSVEDSVAWLDGVGYCVCYGGTALLYPWSAEAVAPEFFDACAALSKHFKATMISGGADVEVFRERVKAALLEAIGEGLVEGLSSSDVDSIACTLLPFTTALYRNGRLVIVGALQAPSVEPIRGLPTVRATVEATPLGGVKAPAPTPAPATTQPAATEKGYGVQTVTVATTVAAPTPTATSTTPLSMAEPSASKPQLAPLTAGEMRATEELGVSLAWRAQMLVLALAIGLTVAALAFIAVRRL